MIFIKNTSANNRDTSVLSHTYCHVHMNVTKGIRRKSYSEAVIEGEEESEGVCGGLDSRENWERAK